MLAGSPRKEKPVRIAQPIKADEMKIFHTKPCAMALL
tara:strand:- start:547 stop:657 length:111 start_codon:yes stop_codon:yes gene_type:complete